MKNEVFNVAKDDLHVSGWSGIGLNPVNGVFTGAEIQSVILTKDANSRQFFISAGLARDIADYIGGEVTVYRERGTL